MILIRRANAAPFSGGAAPLKSGFSGVRSLGKVVWTWGFKGVRFEKEEYGDASEIKRAAGFGLGPV